MKRMEKERNGLFPEYENQLREQTLVLYTPSENKFYTCAESLRCHTVTTLNEWLTPFKELISKYGFRLEKDQSSDKQFSICNRILNTAPTVKETKVLFLAFFLSDFRNFSVYINNLPEEEKEVWRTAIRLVYIDNSLFEKLTGKTLVAYSRWGYIFSTIQNLPRFFNAANVKDNVCDRYGFRKMTWCIYLPDAFRQISFPIFYDGKFKPQALQELPQDKSLRLLTNTEDEITRALPVLQSMIARGILVSNGKGKILKGMRKKIIKQIAFKEYFPEYTFSEQEFMRTDMTLYLAAYLSGASLGSKVENLVGRMFRKIQENSQELLPLFMQHVLGIHLQKVSSHSLYGINTSLFESIKKAEQGWISIEDLIHALYDNRLPAYTYTLIKLSVYNDGDLSNKINGKRIAVSELNKSLFVPYVKGILLMMCSIGLLDVALENTSENPQNSYVDALCYIRLTPLGAYLLGVSKKYKATKIEKKKYFELDENVLILKSIADDNPFMGIVEDVAQPIGGKRYRLSAETFLKNCKTEEDVAKQISLFKQFVSGDCPPVWEDFFKSVQAKCKPLTPIVSNAYRLYKVSSSNKELLHLLSTDPVLKPLVIRAEGYVVLIHNDNLPKVVARLKAFGYLL